MKVTLESTTETAHANGLPVRVWTGTTERGSGVIALITRLAVPDDGHPDDIAQFERELAEPPTRVVDPSGSTIAAPRFCTGCLGRGIRRPATHIAGDASGLQWFECGEHAPSDNLAETERVTLEPLEAWFERNGLPVPPPLTGAPYVKGIYQRPDPRREAIDSILERGAARGSALVKDFWVLYSAARQLHEALITAVDAEHDGTESSGELVARHHQGLAMQLARLEPAFDFCETERRGEPPPSPAADVAAWRAGLVTPAEPELAELVGRARERCSRPDLLAVRHTVSSWLHHDELTLIGPAGLARMILAALDALAIVHGAEAEGDAVELDAFIARSEGDPDHAPPRALTDADREALAALHRWLHHPIGDGGLIEASGAYHDQVEREAPGECARLDAEIAAERHDERVEADYSAQIGARVRAVFHKVGVSLDVPAHELIGAMHERCSPETHWPPPPHAALIIRTIVDDRRVSGKDAGELDAARFLAEALRGARMGWHGRLRHAAELDRLAELAAPKDEPARTPWLFGFHVATTAEPAARKRGSPVLGETLVDVLAAGGEVAFATCRVCGCTDVDCSGCIAKTGEPCHWVEPDLCSACSPAAPTRRVVVIDPSDPAPLWEQAERPGQLVPESSIPAAVLERLDSAEPLVLTPLVLTDLTDAMREYYRIELRYRAPETLNVHERRIIDAVEAEETKRADDPDTWIDGTRGGS